MGAKSGTQTDWCTQPGLSLIQRGLVEKHKTETCLEGIGSVPDGIEPVQLKKSERPERLRKSQAYYRRCLAFFYAVIPIFPYASRILPGKLPQKRSGSLLVMTQ